MNADSSPRSPRGSLVGIILCGLAAASIVFTCGFEFARRNTAPHFIPPSASAGTPVPKDIRKAEYKAAFEQLRAQADELRRRTALTEPVVIVRGRMVTADGSPLPADLTLYRFHSRQDAEMLQLNASGQFTLQVARSDRRLRFIGQAAGFAPLDSNWLKLNDEVELTLTRGVTVTIRPRTRAGDSVFAATAVLRIPRERELGTFPLDADGDIRIPLCPARVVQFGLLVPGFEEQCLECRLTADTVIDVVLRPTRPAGFRVVSDVDGRPIAGVQVHLLSRVRADSALQPALYYDEGPLWATSDDVGRVALTTLCETDPIPTNLPGPAIYGFRIAAAGYATAYVGDVRAGSDLGEIRLAAPLEVTGTIALDDSRVEEAAVSYRQRLPPQGGWDGSNRWTRARIEKLDARLRLTMSDLRPGPVEFLVGYTNPSERSQFRGVLTDSSMELSIARNSVQPGDGCLQVVELAPWSPSGGADLSPEIVTKLSETALFTASSHSQSDLRGRRQDRTVRWMVFVMGDGTIFVPGHDDDAGALHKMSPDELRDFTALLESEGLRFEESPDGLEEFHYSYTWRRAGELRARRFMMPQPKPLDPNDFHRAIYRWIQTARCGGRDELTRFLVLANRALQTIVPAVAPLELNHGIIATNRTDGTRTVLLGVSTGYAKVSVIDPLVGEPYVEYVECLRRRYDGPTLTAAAGTAATTGKRGDVGH